MRKYFWKWDASDEEIEAIVEALKRDLEAEANAKELTNKDSP